MALKMVEPKKNKRTGRDDVIFHTTQAFWTKLQKLLKRYRLMGSGELNGGHQPCQAESSLTE